MKLDIWKWEEIDAAKSFHDAPKGRLRLRLSQVAAVYISADGYEVLAGVGTEIDISTQQEVTFRIEAPANTRAFVEHPDTPTFAPQGERFTNMDRRPDESGTVAEIKRAMRAFELQKRAALAEIARAAKSQEPVAVAPDKPVEKPVVEEPAEKASDDAATE